MRAIALGLHALNLAAVAGLLFLCQQLLRAHDALAAMVVLGVAGLLVLLQFSKRLQAWRYVMPGVSAVLVFIVLPMAFTLGIAFTNYSSAHLLSFERATDALLQRTDSEGLGMDLSLLREGEGAAARYQARLRDDDGGEDGPVALRQSEVVGDGEGGDAGDRDADGEAQLRPPRAEPGEAGLPCL